MNEIYYFGCSQQAGHYLFESKNGVLTQPRYISDEFQCRFGRNGERLDGIFCPPKSWPEGVWMESTVPPWLIISWWDNSIDSRPSSHSTFIGSFMADHAALLEGCKKLFPEVFARQHGPRKGVHLF